LAVLPCGSTADEAMTPGYEHLHPRNLPFGGCLCTGPGGSFLAESQRRKNDFEEVTMRKVVAAEFLSLDGVMEAPDRWHFPYFNCEMEQAIGEGFAASDAMLMGRVNYEEWAAYWPQQDPEQNPVAALMNSRRKYVVSTTLEEPPKWSNSTLIKENVAEEIEKLKNQPGKNMVISGSATLVQSLLRYGLLDELRLRVHPMSTNLSPRSCSSSRARASGRPIPRTSTPYVPCPRVRA
jgi:dihydrofolate reductase